MVAKITLVGNLGGDPEQRRTNDGSQIIACRVASNYRRRDASSGEWRDETNWYRVTTFGRLAERLSQHVGEGRLSKGTRVIVFGRLEASGYMDRNNQPQPSLDVVADDVLLADSRQSDADLPESAARTEPGGRSSAGRTARGQQEDPDDLPF
jgi:single-strand DNA-binding protein